MPTKMAITLETIGDEGDDQGIANGESSLPEDVLPVRIGAKYVSR